MTKVDGFLFADERLLFLVQFVYVFVFEEQLLLLLLEYLLLVLKVFKLAASIF